MAKITGPASISASIDSLSRHSEPQAPLGQIVWSEDGAYRYIRAAAAITASGDAVAPSGAMTTSAGGYIRSASPTLGFGGVAEAPFASGEFGYVKIKGLVNAMVVSGATINALLQTTTTTGALGTITTSGTGIGYLLEDTDGTAPVSVYLL